MKKIILLLLLPFSLMSQDITEDVYQYVLIPVTDSTWNLDVVNVTTSPQQVTRYVNFTKSQIDNFFYDKLLSSHQIVSSNKYKYLIEEIRTENHKSILENNLDFNYAAESNSRFKESYRGSYVFVKSNEQPIAVSIDTAVFVYTTVFDTVVSTIDTLVDGVQAIVSDTVINQSAVRTELFQIIPVSSNLFKLKLPNGITIEICSEDRKRWIGKYEDQTRSVNDVYYFKKR